MMKFVLIISVFLIVFYFIATVATNVIVKPKKILVGYCPTMAKYVENLKNNPEVSLILYNSTQDALAQLAQNTADVVVIGRKAKQHEVQHDISALQFDENATTLVKRITTKNEDAFLMPWSEVDYSAVELVVITDENGQKLAAHRTPFLYYSNQKNINHIEKIANLIKGKI